MLWFAVAFLVLALSYFYLVKPLRYWKELGVPQFSVAENAFFVVRDAVSPQSIGTLIDTWYNKFHNVRYSGMYQFTQPALLIKDPDLIKQITVKDFDHFVDHFQFLSNETVWEKNLFALRGDKWRDMRATLSPSFTSSKMKLMFGLMSDCAKQFVHHFQNMKEATTVVEMKDCFSRFANDIIATTAFGVTCNSLEDRDNEFYVMGKKMTDFSGVWNNLKFTLIILLPNFSSKVGLKIFGDDVYNFFKRLVTENIRTREREGIVRPDMIHLLMEAKKGRESSVPEQNGVVHEGFSIGEDDPKPSKRQKAQLTEEDIMAQALIFFFAGFDTISSEMCFMSYELAINPDIQKRLQDEVDATLEECGGSVTYEALLKMEYMDMVVSETMRKWPVATVVDRICVKPYTVQPKRAGENPISLGNDDLVWIPIYGLHRDPEFYPDPDRFDPERFNDENKSKIAPYTYLPFGVGPRGCLGNRFALMEIKLVFFHILSKFEIAVVEKTPIPLKLASNPTQLAAEGGFWLGLKKRV